MKDAGGKLHDAPVHRMCFDADAIYTSFGKQIIKWDKKRLEATACYTVPPNDNLQKGARFCVDDRNIYLTSLYFFYVMDKATGEVLYQKQFGTDNSSDFDLGTVLVDEQHVHFPQRNRGLVVVEKGDYGRERYLNEKKGSVWALAQDEHAVYFGGVDKNIYGFDKATLQPTGIFPGHRGNIHDLYSYGEYLVSLSSDNSIVIWDTRSGSMVQQLKKAQCSLGSVIMTDQYLVCAAKGRLRVWETSGWSQVAEAAASGTMFFDEGVIYLADRHTSRVQIMALDDLVKSGE